MGFSATGFDFPAFLYSTLCIITAFGGGRLLFGAQLFRRAPGLVFLAGLYSIPVALFVLNSIVGINLFVAAYAVLALSVVGVALAIRDPKAEPQPHWHPFFFALLLLVAASAAHYFPNYHPSAWDEFTHWMLMPKQILRFGTAISAEFNERLLLEYPPGWSLALDYPFFLMGRGFYSEALMPLFLALGAMGSFAAAYDVVALAAPGQSRFWPVAAALACLVLCVPCRPITGTLLIEAMLNQLAALTFLILIACTTGAVSLRRLALCLAIVSTSGVLAKKSFFSESLAATLAFGVLWWQAHGLRAWWRGVAWAALTVLLPLGSLFVWNRLGDSIGLERFFSYNTPVNLTDPQQQEFLIALAKYFGRILIQKAPIASVLMLLAVLVAVRVRSQRSVALMLVAQAGIFFVGSFVVYVKGFGPFGWQSAPSFERYSSLIYESGAFAAIIVLALEAQRRWAVASRSSLFSVGAVLLLCGFGAFRARAAIREFPLKAVLPAVAQANQLHSHMDQAGKSRAHLLFIDQKRTAVSRGPVRYGLTQVQGTVVDRFAYDSFAPTGDASPREALQVNAQSFREILRKMDYIWIYTSDAFVLKMLGPYVSGPQDIAAGGWFEKVSSEPPVFRPLPGYAVVSG